MAVQLRDNDLELLRAIVQARFLSTTLAAEFFFKHRTNACRRLYQLCRAGYVKKVQLAVTEEALWTATPAAVRALKESGTLTADTPSSSRGRIPGRLYVNHELALNQLQLSFRAAAAEREDVEVVSWRAGSHAQASVKDRDGKELPVIPDGLLTLGHRGSRLHFALELDRGTKPLERHSKGTDVRKQLAAYPLALAQGWGGSAFGRPGQSPEAVPFRVLSTAPTWTRLVSMVATLVAHCRRRGLGPSGLRAYGLFSSACRDPLGAVWLAECQVAPFLTWLQERVPVGAPLASCLAAHDADVREALGAWGSLPFRRRGRTRIVCDPAVRAAFVEALVAVKRVELVSPLDPSWSE